MREYRLSLVKYGINEYRFEELNGFCLQYGEKKKKISKPETIRSKDVLQKYISDIQLIDNIANEVDENFAPYLIEAVTNKIEKFETFKNKYNLDINFSDFCKKRRLFYCFLNAKL